MRNIEKVFWTLHHS